jgi:hypothetical protein
MKTVLSVAIALASLTAPHHAAVSKTSFSFQNTVSGTGETHPRVDQQTWWLDSGTPDPDHLVTNPDSGCSWDINEYFTAGTATGNLSPGGSSSTGFCHIYDYNPIYQCVGGTCQDVVFHKNWAGFVVNAASPDLTVSICFSPGTCFTPSAQAVGTGRQTSYDWRFCGYPVYTQNDPAIQPIPNSGYGGYGAKTTITITVSNASSATIKNVSAGWGLSSDVFFPPGCPSDGTAPGPNVQNVYPFVWSQS